MNGVTIIWSAVIGACLMQALMHLLVWTRDRRSWAHLCLVVTVLSVVGMAVCELLMMHAESPAAFARIARWAHPVYGVGVAGSLGFVHFYFGTARGWLLALALGLRTAAVAANFTTGINLHISVIHSLDQIPFLGGQVSVLGAWEPSPWVRLGQAAALLQLACVLDAAASLWRTGQPESKRRALIVGGSLAFFIVLAAGQPGLVAAGVLRMPFIVSFSFLGMVLAMGHELSRDVLRAARLSRDLQASEHRFRRVIEASPHAMAMIDEEGKIRLVNAQTESVFGHTRDELLGLPFEELVPSSPETTRPAPGPGGAAPPANETTEAGHEAVGRRKDGTAVPLEIGFSALGTAEEDFVLASMIDVTWRRRAEQEAAHHRQELAHLSRVSILGELSGSLAHELNQPLAAILSNSQVGRQSLQPGPPDLAEMAAILDDISDDAKRAGGIIHGMRAMFKKETAAESHPVEVATAVHQVLGLLRGEIVARQVTVDLRLADDLPPVRAGLVELQQILMNLLVNSLDAVKTAAPPGRVTITAAPHDDRVIVSVRDNGPGLAPGQEDQLFEPFSTTKPAGLGLGLAISRRLATQFGGTLEAENHPDGGADFRLTLPAARNEQSHLPARPTPGHTDTIPPVPA